MNPLTATYFPFSHISSSLLEILSCFFDRLVLYQPAGLPTGDNLRRLSSWTDRGFLDIRTFCAAPADEKKLQAEFQNWKTWGALYEKDLNYLKHMHHSLAPNSPIVPAMVSEIKGKGRPKKEETDALFACHLFLLLAHDFDRQSLELQAQLDSVNKQQKLLQSFLQTGVPDEEPDTVLAPAFQNSPEDLGARMTENRIHAWMRLFREEKNQGNIFITDSEAVYRYMLEETEDKLDMGELPLPDPKSVTEQTPVRTAFSKMLTSLLTTPWSHDLVKETTQAMEAMKNVIGSHPNGTSAAQGAILSHWILTTQAEGKFFQKENTETIPESAESKHHGHDDSNALIGLVTFEKRSL